MCHFKKHKYLLTFYFVDVRLTHVLKMNPRVLSTTAQKAILD